ncbi:MAG: hypothetical protein IMZ64_00670 [Bacteroidetes bacterium]|nr:hypothetical protein [Bacteroidota bacterium]
METIQSNQCPICSNNAWRKEPIFELINSNGEYVKGYGSMPVMKQKGDTLHCVCCGYEQGKLTTVIILEENK